eukprot:4505623-Prymnesium_polylepis.1
MHIAVTESDQGSTSSFDVLEVEPPALGVGGAARDFDRLIRLESQRVCDLRPQVVGHCLPCRDANARSEQTRRAQPRPEEAVRAGVDAGGKHPAINLVDGGVETTA